jgi:hypothetical protein
MSRSQAFLAFLAALHHLPVVAHPACAHVIEGDSRQVGAGPLAS